MYRVTGFITVLITTGVGLSAGSVAAERSPPQAEVTSPIDTSAIAKDFIDACMGDWVSAPVSRKDSDNPFRLRLYPDFRFEAQFPSEQLSGDWFAVGTLDAAVRMTDPKTGKELEIAECPGDKPTVFIGVNEYPVRRPSR